MRPLRTVVPTALWRCLLLTLISTLLLALAGCREKQSTELLEQARSKERDAGQVQPSPPTATVLTFGQNLPRDLLQDESALYWRNEGTRAEGEPGIFKVSKRGGAAVRLVPEKGVYALAADDSSLYWINPMNGTVSRVSKDGVTVTPVATEQENLCCLALDATHVYWASAEGIFRVSKEGGKPQAVHSNLSLPGQVVADGSMLWWYSPISGRLARSAKAGGAPKSVLNEDATLHAFAVDDTHLYWSFGSQKKMQVRRMPKGGGAPQTLVEGQDPPVDFFLGSADVWWTTGDDVLRVPKAGGAAVKVVERTDRALEVVADDSAVYWTDRMGRVQSASKR